MKYYKKTGNCGPVPYPDQSGRMLTTEVVSGNEWEPLVALGFVEAVADPISDLIQEPAPDAGLSAQVKKLNEHRKKMQPGKPKPKAVQMPPVIVSPPKKVEAQEAPPDVEIPAAGVQVPDIQDEEKAKPIKD